MRYFLFSLITLLAGCGSASNLDNRIVLPYSIEEARYLFPSKPHYTALSYINFSETTHRTELRSFLGIDPVKTEWCAAFVNSVLDESGIPSNRKHKYPLTARAFLDWGIPVSKNDIQPGDLVVFPRGNEGWQGHVGFYIRTMTIDNIEYYFILGGNQSNKVSVELYPANTSLGIRRYSA